MVCKIRFLFLNSLYHPTGGSFRGRIMVKWECYIEKKGNETGMEDMFRKLTMRYPLRDYQQRVMDRIDLLMEDDKLHVAAAPGAGKTVLGLEVIRHLGERTLILVPTINLRNQWKERFADIYFGGNGSLQEGLFSTDFRSPGLITCMTYQAMYQAETQDRGEGRAETDEATETDEKKPDETEAEDGAAIGNAGLLQAFCRENRIGTVCLDEAHHLKREWWKALTNLLAGIRVKLVALTATPPMDTSDTEWKRYIGLCGEIDMEISIPEMVGKKCLCPHQDFLYIATPLRNEEEKIRILQAETDEAVTEILRNPSLYTEIRNHPVLRAPEEKQEVLLAHPAFLTHILAYMLFVKKTWQVELEGDRFQAEKAFSGWDKRILSVFREEERKHPEELHYRGYMDVADYFVPLMRDILEHDPASFSEQLRTWLSERLIRCHMMKNGKITDKSDDEIDKILGKSGAKLDAITDIIRQESRNMGENLRCLVLMDHIRKEDMAKVESDALLSEPGVSTVFEKLRREEHLGNLEKYFAADTAENPVARRTYRTRLGVLSGSMVILPDPLMERLLAETDWKGSAKKLGLTGYSLIEQRQDRSDSLVSLVTGYFTEGAVEILIGTAALLGEGWDAPAVNTLIIGSASRMYVKTNQMRGRALRIRSGAPDKAANIWHLMAYLPGTDNTGEVQAMRQRFLSITGLSMDGREISSGWERLVPAEQQAVYAMNLRQIAGKSEGWNSMMFRYAADRESMRHAWERMAGEYRALAVRDVVTVETGPSYKASGGLPLKRLSRLADGMARTLQEKGMLHSGACVRPEKRGNRQMFYLDDVSERDARLFASCMKEALAAGTVPKYLVQFGFFRKNYASVPSILNAKGVAESFAGNTGGKLIPVSTDKGKKILLKQRLRESMADPESVKNVRRVL